MSVSAADNSATHPATTHAGVKQRLMRGFGAHAMGSVVTTIVQVVSVPVFLHCWGAKLYGEWLILSAIPTYLTLSDLGFGNVSGNEMTMQVAAGDKRGAIKTFQSMLALTCIVSVVCGICAIGCVQLLPWYGWVKISQISLPDARTILTLLFLSTLMYMQGNLTMGGFRCDGHFATGIFLINIFRFIEAMAGTAVVLLHGTPLRVAQAYLAARVLSIITQYGWMLRVTPWIRLGFSQASSAKLRQLTRPAFAYMAFPLGLSLSIQGMVIVIGAVAGPIAVATFSTMRTLTRFAVQVVEAVKNTVWNELSSAYGSQNWTLARKLHRAACNGAIWMSSAAALFLAIWGAPIYKLWTHGRVTMDPIAFKILLLVVVANSFWNTSSAVMIAANRHERLAMVFLATTSVSLVLAYFLLPRFGIAGAAASLLAIDFGTSGYVLRQSLRMLHEPPVPFARALFSVPKLSTLRG
jgi:O-antigen/teichoic acid export membrane protein